MGQYIPVLRSKQSGFTLVELLVVIVVIAILASITIVAYNGITDRANAAQANGAMEQYIKALSMYSIDHGTYPNPTSPSGSTIGCFDGTTNCSGTVNQTTSTALINAVKEETGAIPSQFYSWNTALIQYTAAAGYYVKYYIPASQNCPSTLATATNTQNQVSGNQRACWMVLPSPN